MATGSRRRFVTSLVRRATLAAPIVGGLGLIGIACGSGDAPPAPSPHPGTALGGTAPHAIHVFARGADGSRTQMDFGQATELRPTSSSSASASAERAAIHVDDTTPGGAASTPPPTVDDPAGNFAATAWELVARAVAQCGMPGAEQLPPWQLQQTGQSPPLPATLQGFYVYSPTSLVTSFHGSPEFDQKSSCAVNLEVEQNLLCVADKLAEIGDAVGVVDWPAVTTSTTDGTYTYGGAPPPQGAQFYEEWEIPPQADADRFIVRDLAIHTLAMIPTLDAVPINPFGEALPPTCSAALAEAANGHAMNDDSSLALFGVPTRRPDWAGPPAPNPPLYPVFPPSPVPILDADGVTYHAGQIAVTALQIEAQILRGGGRLLHDLIRRDVYSDLAAAASLRAGTLGPLDGNAAAWGQSAQGPYGTIAHAGRVLFGRWEIGDALDFPANHDPACEGVASLDLVTKALGTDLPARVQDSPIVTVREATAVRLVEEAGIVLPSCAITVQSATAAARTSQTPLGKALVDQLVLEETNRDGLSAPPPVRVYQNTVDGLTPSELASAYQHVLHTYLLLTNSPDDTQSGAACVPFTLAASTGLHTAAAASSVGGIGGIVIAGGLPQSRLSTDTFARAGGLTEASQCNVASGTWSMWGTAWSPGAPGTLPPEVFQDAFHVGQAFERRLSMIESASNIPAVKQSPAIGPDGSGDPEIVSRGGLAELRTWAGSVGVRASAIGPANSPTATSFTLDIAGVSPSDFGALTTDLSPIQSAFGFVYGPPWLAECAAGVRSPSDCPSTLSQSIQTASSVSDVTGQYASAGVVDHVYELQIPLNGALASFTLVNESAQPPTAPGESHLYMVRLHDPGNPLGRGHVIGTLPLGYTQSASGQGPSNGASVHYTTVSLVDAPMQRELAHDALDLGAWIGAAPPRLGDPSAATTAGPCVDGVPRDLFVPLDNQLGSSNASYEDSWQHYLDLAQQAAQTADTLGQALIADDLQISQREESAAENLAQLCGNFGALSGVSVASDGTTLSGTNDPATTSCLSEDTIDVVFLGDYPSTFPTSGTDTNGAPIPSTDPAVVTSFVQGPDVLNCQQQTATAKSPLCNKSTLTAGALHITKSVTQSGAAALGAGFTGACDALVGNGGVSNVVNSLRSGFQGTNFLQILNDATLGTNAVETIASSLKMNVDLFGNWTVTLAGQTVMSSHRDNDDPKHFWPACLSLDPHCNNVSQNPREIGTMNALNSTFRWCSNPAAPLGCDGPTADPNANAQAELNILRWRVTQAMWLMGVAQGVVPKGMFTLPVPVLAAADGWNGGGCGSFPWTACYPGSLYQVATNVVCPPGSTQNCLAEWKLNTGGTAPSSSLDNVSLGAVFDVPASFKLWPTHAGSEVPSWYLSAYQPSNVKHAMVSNAEVAFSLKGGFTTDECTSPPSATPESLFNLMAGATLDGAICAAPYSDPTGPTGLGNTTWRVLSADVECASSPRASPPSDVDSSNAANTPLSVSPASGTNSPLLPSAFGPQDRMPYFLGSADFDKAGWSGYQMGGSLRGGCSAIAQALQAAALTCIAPQAVQTTTNTGAVTASSVPQITSPNSIPILEGWLGLAGQVMSTAVGKLYATSLPARVVKDFNDGTVGTGDTAGEKGQAVLGLETSLQTLPSDWAAIVTDLDGVRGAISSARLAIQAANLQDQSAQEGIEMQHIQIQGQMAQAIDTFLETMASAGSNWQSMGASSAVIPFALLSMYDAEQTGNAELNELTKEQQTANDQAANNVAQALATLDQTTSRLWGDVQTHLDAIRGDVARVLSSGQQIQNILNDASYQAAVGTGADFAIMPDGSQVAIPVNTVLRRQASATKQRYDSALKNAKALAYMARRAIEQRIGVPLEAITVAVGPLGAPASWADDLCSLQGVNYASLSTASPATDGGADSGIGGGQDRAAINQFANAWIGDYVAKLQGFVAYYNAQYPSHQGSDTAVVSLRDDLLNAVPQCMALAPNFLVSSGDLSQVSALVSTAGGWQMAPCSGAQKCLAAIDGTMLLAPNAGPEGGANAGMQSSGVTTSFASGVTWLVDLPGTGTTTADAGSGSVAPNMVSQAVQLQPGNYVLSWWDQAREFSGAVWAASDGSPASYVVNVLDGSSRLAAGMSRSPFVPVAVDAGSSAPMWSARRALTFTVTQPDTYRVAFGASPAGTSLGSVAIADVQLESATVTGEPTVYVATGASRMVAATTCPNTPADLRAAFQHTCDGNGNCSYDLIVPLVVNSAALWGDVSPLDAKLAPGNYNYRHGTLALNLVGTAVHDCSNDPSSNCYGSGFIQYDLIHDASSAGIVSYDGNARAFDFGVAAVNHGKALAAERSLTVPLGSADQGLINQPGILHEELSGRPLDGSYRIRIWDSPDLNWGALEDVQIVLNYDYWSQIQTGGVGSPATQRKVHAKPIAVGR